MNIVSLKKIGTPAVAKFAGFLAFATLAIAFFAAPLSTSAMCGIKTQKATFVGLASDVVWKDPTQTTNSQILTFTPAKNGPIAQGDWIVVRFDSNKTLWAASFTSAIRNGQAKGLTVNDTNQLPAGAKKVKTVTGTPLTISGIPATFDAALVSQTLITPLSAADLKGPSTGWAQIP